MQVILLLPLLRLKANALERRVPGRGSSAGPSAPAMYLYNPKNPQTILKNLQTLVWRSIPVDLLLAIQLFSLVAGQELLCAMVGSCLAPEAWRQAHPVKANATPETRQNATGLCGVTDA